MVTAQVVLDVPKSWGPGEGLEVVSGGPRSSLLVLLTNHCVEEHQPGVCTSPFSLSADTGSLTTPFSLLRKPFSSHVCTVFTFSPLVRFQICVQLSQEQVCDEVQLQLHPASGKDQAHSWTGASKRGWRRKGHLNPKPYAAGGRGRAGSRGERASSLSEPSTVHLLFAHIEP